VPLRRMRDRWVWMLLVVTLAGGAGAGADAARAGHLLDDDLIDVELAPADDEPSDDDLAPSDDDLGPDDDDWIDAYDSAPHDQAWRDSIRLGRVDDRYRGRGVTVAVIDTGATRHPDLGDRVASRIDLTPEGDGFDRYGHGTSMTGIIAGDGTASEGRFRGSPRQRASSPSKSPAGTAPPTSRPCSPRWSGSLRTDGATACGSSTSRSAPTPSSITWSTR
jgi:hypothetical protein